MSIHVPWTGFPADQRASLLGASPGRLDMLPAQLLNVSTGFGTEPTAGEKLPRGACGKMVLRNEGASVAGVVTWPFSVPMWRGGPHHEGLGE